MTHRATLSGRGYEASQDSPRLRFRRALTLLFLAIVLPGAAQVLAGRRWFGWLGVLTWVGAICAGAVVAWQRGLDRVTLLEYLTDADVLFWARITLVAVVLFWGVYFLDAWRLAHPFRLPFFRSGAVLLLNAGVVAAVAAGTVFASNLLVVQRDVVETVFSATATSKPLEGRYNILLIGADSGPERVGIRPDSLTVASIDTSTGKTVLVSVPRNLQNVPFREDSPMRAVYPYGYNCGPSCLINAVHTAAANRFDLYPTAKDPGLWATIDAVEGATDLSINYFVMVNLKGFRQLVDAVGGVEINVKSRIAMFGHDDAWKQTYIEPGLQRLNGQQALWYGRSRVQADDFTRMGRQKCLMAAMLQQLSPQKVLLNAQQIGASSKQLLRTNIPATELAQFGDLALKARDQKIATVSLVPPIVNTVNPDFPAIHQMIAEAIEASETPTPSTSETPDASPTPSPTSTVDNPRAANNSDDLEATC